MTNEQLCALAKQGDADAQNLLIENKKNGMVRSINMRPTQMKGSGMLRGHKQTMIDDNDIRVICDN